MRLQDDRGEAVEQRLVVVEQADFGALDVDLEDERLERRDEAGGEVLTEHDRVHRDSGRGRGARRGEAVAPFAHAGVDQDAGGRCAADGGAVEVDVEALAVPFEQAEVAGVRFERGDPGTGIPGGEPYRARTNVGAQVYDVGCVPAGADGVVAGGDRTAVHAGAHVLWLYEALLDHGDVGRCAAVVEQTLALRGGEADGDERGGHGGHGRQAKPRWSTSG